MRVWIDSTSSGPEHKWASTSWLAMGWLECVGDVAYRWEERPKLVWAGLRDVGLQLWRADCLLQLVLLDLVEQAAIADLEVGGGVAAVPPGLVEGVLDEAAFGLIFMVANDGAHAVDL